MLALVVARPGPVCDGLVALLGATPNVRKIVQIARSEDAWDFVQTICPKITIIHASPLTDSLANLISQMRAFCRRPILAIVNSEEDRQTAVAFGADVVVMEGLPSSKLAVYISSLTESSISSPAPIPDKRA
jgi:DNA-binding NarL/FixJ family response regulator